MTETKPTHHHQAPRGQRCTHARRRRLDAGEFETESLRAIAHARRIMRKGRK